MPDSRSLLHLTCSHCGDGAYVDAEGVERCHVTRLPTPAWAARILDEAEGC